MVPFNDLSRLAARYESELSKAIAEVVRKGWWLLGEASETFSRNFADYCGARYCLPVANGTDALELALRAVLHASGPGEKAEVILAANAGGYGTTACRLAGAMPVYVDIHEETQLVNFESIANCLGPDVKAVLVTHLYGAAVDVPQLRQLLEANGYGHVAVIEDCAQAHGARIGERRVGSLGDVAAFSFYPTKNLGALGDAGALVTSSEQIFEHVKHLHQYGWDRKYHVSLPFGRNSRMDEIQAAVLNCLLPQVDGWNTRRYQIWQKYCGAKDSKLRFLDYNEGAYVAHLAVVLTLQRKEFMEFMGQKGIKTDIHYPVLDCDQPGWKDLPMRCDKQSNLEVSHRSVQQIVSLPCFPLLTDVETEQVCQALAEWGSR